MTVTLQVEARAERGKQVAKLRASGKLPAVVYGPKEDATPITVDQRIFDKLFREAGESTIITLQGVGEDKEVLVHDVAFDPAKGGPVHVDFYAIERGKELTTHVPLEFEGEAPAVKQGGSLTKVLYEVEVTCRPSALPQHITVDVSGLDDFDKQIHVRDLVAPADVTIENDPEEVVAMVQESEEEPEEAPEAVDMDSIEVEEKGKKDDEGDADESSDA